MKTINLISFGCPKNLVDSETILGLLATNGYAFIADHRKADILILNTCGFLKTARNEAYSVIKRISITKSANQKLVICGCLPQFEKDLLLAKFPKIDALLGSSDFPLISKILDRLVLPGCAGHKLVHISKPNFLISNEPKILSTPRSYAYIKIADGCNNRCAYCLIPYLRGAYRSRQIQDIFSDVKAVAETGRKEVILVAQDTTLYGIDIYGKPALPKLLTKLSTIRGIKWIRLLYTHPAHFSDELINTIAGSQKIAKYIDMPIQHTVDTVLKTMGRPASKSIFETIEKLRKNVPVIALRTTVMVGYPGETDRCFKQLLNDIRQIQFDWLGAFIYSSEKGTKAYKLKGAIPVRIQKQRLAELMKIQQKITFDKNQALVGRRLEVLADNPKFGHIETQAPEIDGKVAFYKPQKEGALIKAKITAVKRVYDLEAFNDSKWEVGSS